MIVIYKSGTIREIIRAYKIKAGLTNGELGDILLSIHTAPPLYIILFIQQCHAKTNSKYQEVMIYQKKRKIKYTA